MTKSAACSLMLLILMADVRAASTYSTTKAVIFDCDGVLIDTEGFKLKAWREAVKPFGIEISNEQYANYVGYSTNKIFELIKKDSKGKITSANKQSIVSLRESAYQEFRKKQKPDEIKEIVEILRRVYSSKKGKNIKLGLASSAGNKEIRENLKQLGVIEYFDAIVSGKDDLADYPDKDGKNKPKPYIYIETLKRLEISPKNAIVIEDTSVGALAAIDAGISTVIGYPNKYTYKNKFPKSALRIDKNYSLLSKKILEFIGIADEKMK